jgi:Reprolysin family propeptide.
MDIKFNALGKKFHLNLEQNKKLLSPKFQVQTLDENGETIHSHGMRNCYYEGKVESHVQSMVAISTCNGLVS